MQKALLEKRKQDVIGGLKAFLQWLRAFLNSYFFYVFEFYNPTTNV